MDRMLELTHEEKMRDDISLFMTVSSSVHRGSDACFLVGACITVS